MVMSVGLLVRQRRVVYVGHELGEQPRRLGRGARPRGAVHPAYRSIIKATRADAQLPHARPDLDLRAAPSRPATPGPATTPTRRSPKREMLDPHAGSDLWTRQHFSCGGSRPCTRSQAMRCAVTALLSTFILRMPSAFLEPVHRWCSAERSTLASNRSLRVAIRVPRLVSVGVLGPRTAVRFRNDVDDQRPGAIHRLAPRRRCTGGCTNRCTAPGCGSRVHRYTYGDTQQSSPPAHTRCPRQDSNLRPTA
jgi:hypothetical protein